MTYQFNFSESFARCYGSLPIEENPDFHVTARGTVLDMNGRIVEQVCRNGKRLVSIDGKLLPVDKLVLKAYGMRYRRRQDSILHIDGNADNNDVRNLVWSAPRCPKYVDWCMTEWKPLSIALSVDYWYANQPWSDAESVLTDYFKRPHVLSCLRRIKTNERNIWHSWVDGSRTPISVYNIYSGDFDEFDSLYRAAAYIDIDREDLIRLLSWMLFPVLPSGWMITRGHVLNAIDADMWPWFLDDKCTQVDMRTAIAFMQITNQVRMIEYLNNGHIEYYQSIDDIILAHPECSAGSIRGMITKPVTKLKTDTKQYAYFPTLTDLLEQTD